MGVQADIARDSGREFLASHPWLKFELRRLDQLPAMFWEQLGEARSKCLHLARTPLPPGLSAELSSLYLAKGVHATTAIEGNSLTEEQVLDAVQGRLEVPRSQEYLKREIENIANACSAIEQRIYGGDTEYEITPDLLRGLNRQVLDGLDVEDHVVPGQFREGSVVVGNVYRGAPAKDSEFLVGLLCDWLNGPDFARTDDTRQNFLRAVLRAILAHVYIAWIHPFGDGNGRTARLIEFGILTSAGVPFLAAHLLSNHYNQTRTIYYRQLRQASRSGGELRGFLLYAIEGFVDGLQLQLGQVHAHIFGVAWASYVHELFRGADTAAARRQRELVLALPTAEEPWVPRAKIPALTARLAELYAEKTPKTVTRDINALVDRGLVERSRDAIRARHEMMLGFLPPVASTAVF